MNQLTNMSGGHFNYNQFTLNDIASQIQELIDTNNIENEYSQETINKFKKTIDMLTEAGKLVHEIDYLVCGDTSEETFNKL